MEQDIYNSSDITYKAEFIPPNTPKLLERKRRPRLGIVENFGVAYEAGCLLTNEPEDNLRA